MTIEEFLEQRLTEDEAIAAATMDALCRQQDGLSEDWAWYRPSGWGGLVNRAGTRSWGESTPEGAHINRHDPAHVLRQCTALRHAVEMIRLSHVQPNGHSVDTVNLELDLRPIAAIWSDSPDYQSEWVPL